MVKTNVVNEEKIKNRLSEMGYKYEDFKPNIQQHLLKIEGIIEDSNEKYASLITELKNTVPTVLSVSKESKIARQTFYNNTILKEYIEAAANEFHNPFSQIDNLNKKLSDMSEKVEKMIGRDVELELIKLENKELKKQIKKSKDDAEKAQVQRGEAEREMFKLRAELRTLSKSDSGEMKAKNKFISLENKRL